jgi:ornithine cyclodeaminase/alanine dehydrogenase-like protein (mu-crystallin family)
MRFIEETTVADHLHMAPLIDAMRQAMIDFSAGEVEQPVRQSVSANDGFLLLMSAFGQSLGAKLVTLYPGNAERGLDTHNAIIVMFDPETGSPTAVMDGRLITEMRTAAVSAVAANLLSRPASVRLGVLGSGVQARSHIEAMRIVRPIEEVSIWSPTSANAEALAASCGAVAVSSAREAVEGADIVVTATAATSPILNGSWLRPGCHVCSVGAPRPDWRELDDATMRNSVIVDSRQAAEVESGDIIGSQSDIHAELGELLVVPDASLEGETTVFKSRGRAREDGRAAPVGVGSLGAHQTEQCLRLEVEDLCCVTTGHGQKHLVATFGLDNNLARNHRHHNSTERLSAVLRPTLVEVISANPFREQSVVIALDEGTFVCSSHVRQQPGSEEVRQIGSWTSVRRRLPIDDGEGIPLLAEFAEHHVVEAIVAMRHNQVRLGCAVAPCPERTSKPFEQTLVINLQPAPDTVHEAGKNSFVQPGNTNGTVVASGQPIDGV